MKLFMCPNLSKERYIKSSLKCINSLIDNGFDCYFSKADSLTLFKKEYNVSSPSECDIIVSVGGDGAVLSASGIAFEFDKPLMGINGGRLGYLCAYELDEISSVTEKDIMSLCHSPRSAVSFSNGEKTFKALNDIVIAKDNYGSVIKTDVFCDGKKLMSFRGDGVIVSTPTGSTSYNFSAGGPILSPDSKCIAITPICPHLSDARTLVVPDTYVLDIKVSENSQNKAYLYCDGIVCSEPCTAVTIKKYPREVTLLVKDSCSVVNSTKLHKTSLI